jgi:metal-dependent amidase/aminoacylase/carboxypeptidase family protein
MRAGDSASRRALEDRMRGCFGPARWPPAAHYEIVEAAPAYAELAPDRWLAEVFRAEMVRMGRVPVPADVEAGVPLGSTDMGNVTQCCPASIPSSASTPGERSSTSPVSPRPPSAPARMRPSSRVRSCWRAPSLRWPTPAERARVLAAKADRA